MVHSGLLMRFTFSTVYDSFPRCFLFCLSKCIKYELVTLPLIGFMPIIIHYARSLKAMRR